MPTVTKRLVRPGTFRDKYGTVGTINDDRIKNWEQTHKQLRSRGFYIPIPTEHDDSKPVKTKPKRHIDKMWIGEDGWLYSTLEVDEDDVDEVTSTDVSIHSFDDMAAVENVSNDYIGHVALTKDPACLFQGPALTNQPQMCLALSSSVCLSHDSDTSVNGNSENMDSSIASCLKILQGLGLKLPSDTNEMNLCERIVIAGQAVLDQTNQESDDFTKEPEGTETKKPSPIAMSNPVLQLALSKLERGHVKDPHGNAYTEESLQAELAATQQTPATQPPPPVQALSTPQLPTLTPPQPPRQELPPMQLALSRGFAIKDLQHRINECTRTGKIGPDVTNKYAKPLFDSLVKAAVSNDEAAIETSMSQLNAILPAWESLPANGALALSNGQLALSGLQIQQPPQDPEGMTQDLSADQIDSLVAEQLKA